MRDCLKDESAIWIDIQGLGDEAMLQSVAEMFTIHPIALEDIVNVPQRPKVEVFDHHTTLITRMVRVGESSTITREQVSIPLERQRTISSGKTTADDDDSGTGHESTFAWQHAADHLGPSIDWAQEADYTQVQSASIAFRRVFPHLRATPRR